MEIGQDTGPLLRLLTGEPPDLGPGPRAGVLSEKALDERLGELWKEKDRPPASRKLVRALVLLWHDHLETAHTLAQAIENADGSLLHGIVHRREPDYGNAKYWFRRVGWHPVFPELARRVDEFLAAEKQGELRRQLTGNGGWNPMAFVDLCEQAAGRPEAGPLTRILKEIQGIELQALLAYYAGL